MILQSISNAIRKQDWIVVFIELMVVIIGLVLAFQVDRWWEERADRSREREYMNRLITEVKNDIEEISHAYELAEVRQGFGDLLIEVSTNPLVAKKQPAMFLAAVAQAAFTYTPSLTSHTFEDLRSTGNMGLIRNTDIRNALYSFYGFHDAQSQFIQLKLNIEMRYFELAAVVLSAEQYQWVQDQWFVVTKNDLEKVRQAQPDLEAFSEAVDRFIGNPELLAWLPRTRGIQREQLLMHGILLSRAEDLVASLQDYSITLGQ
jgi:hypothetical protein